MICQVEAKESLEAGKKTSPHYFRQSFPYHRQVLGPARGFGYMVPGALLIQVYGIFLSQFEYKVSCFSWIIDIQFIDVN